MNPRAAVPPGHIRARGLGRRFEIVSGGPRSLKEVLLRRKLPEKRELWALRGVDLDLAPGETFGIVGQNGSGKSTLLRLLAGIFAPSEGALEVEGRVGSLIDVGAGFHPDFSGIENVYLDAAIHGLKRSYVDEHLDEILAFAELERFAAAPVKTYSSGMFLRLGFSVAIHVDPDILLVDEVLAVGDEEFQRKCYGKIADFKRAGGTLVFVSHDASAVEWLCDRAILLEHGRIVELGTAEEVLRSYHQRLARRAVARRKRTGDGQAELGPGACRVVNVRAVGGDGATRDQLFEAEPVMLEATLYAEDHLRARVTFTVREANGHLVGAETASDVALRAHRAEPIQLHFAALPVREGRFFVDVTVMSRDGDAELASVQKALELSVFSTDASAEGPVRLGGRWELPRASAEPLVEAEAAER